MAIKLRGSSGGSKPATRKSSTTRKSTSAKPAAKRGTARSTGTRKSVTRKPKAAVTESSRRPTTKDEKVLAKWEKILTEVGGRYEEIKEAHKEIVQEVYEVGKEAMDAGIPTGMISDNLGLSRQWLYKIGTHAGRDGKPAPKRGRPSAGSAQKTSNGRKTTSAKRGSSTKSTRPKIRTR